MAGKTVDKRRIQESLGRRQADYDRIRAQILRKTQEKSKSAQPDFSKIHPASAPEHPLPIHYWGLSENQVTEIQLTNYKALESKQQQNLLAEIDDSRDWFRPSVTPMDDDTETSPQDQISNT